MEPISLESEIQARIDHGDVFLNKGDFAAAVKLYREALAMIPEPKVQYEIALPAFTALGEAYFYSGNYANALVALREALKAPGGVENPLLHLRLGQTYYESGQLDPAADSLTKSYALGGSDIFKGEDDKYVTFLATRIEL
jgi:tetratricopeptide (TPR) repeat protein